MNFSDALECVKKGARIHRDGWNGKGMFVYYVPKGSYAPYTHIANELINNDGLVEYEPYLAIKNVKGTVSTWVPSINDILANDWNIDIEF